MNKVVSALVVAFAGAAAASLLTTWRKSHGSESPGKRRSDGKTMAQYSGAFCRNFHH